MAIAAAAVATKKSVSRSMLELEPVFPGEADTKRHRCESCSAYIKARGMSNDPYRIARGDDVKIFYGGTE